MKNSIFVQKRVHLDSHLLCGRHKMQHPSPLWPCCPRAGGVLQGPGLRLPMLELFNGQRNRFNLDLRSWLQIQKDPHSCLLGRQALHHFVLACLMLVTLGALMGLERWDSSFRSTALSRSWMLDDGSMQGPEQILLHHSFESFDLRSEFACSSRTLSRY